MTDFKLVPFNDNPTVTLSGAITQSSRRLHLDYQLEGELEQIHWPLKVLSPTRQFNLWQTTCFELFLSIPAQKRYYEFNFSPSGNWHSFSFSDYRTDMRISKEIRLVSAEVVKHETYANVNICIDCLIPGKVTDLMVGVTAILHQHPDAYHHYFHHRDHHTLSLTIPGIEDGI